MTHWTLVSRAQRSADSDAREALASLCRMYWYPLYALARRSGFGPHDAEDLTQGYFAEFLSKDYLGSIAKEKGRLRSFLCVSFNHFMSKQRERDRAQKRGGGAVPLAIDHELAEKRYRYLPADHLTPEDVFERHYVLLLLEHGMNELEQEQRAKGKGELFGELKGALDPAGETRSYAELAVRTGRSVGAVKTEISRLRSRFRELLKAQIAQTVGSEEDLADEIRHLFAVFGAK